MASVMDSYPEREPTLSKPLTLIIIGSEKHAEMIRAQIDGVIAEIAEIAEVKKPFNSRRCLQKKMLGRVQSNHSTPNNQLKSIILKKIKMI